MLKVSVIIPTYNRLNQLKQVLAAFEAQSCNLSDIEIIIVSDGSSDGTESYLNDLKSPLNLVVAQQQNAGPAAARNNGIGLARGELVIFVDDDVVPAPDFIIEHLKSHEKYGQQAVVLGPMITPNDFEMVSWVYWEQMMLYKQYEDMEMARWEPTARQFYTGNASLRRKHLIESGGFDVSFRRAEDVELAYRLADKDIRFYFNPQAIGYHYAERKFESWLQTPYMYGRNDVIFTRDKGQKWLLPKVMEEFHQRHLVVRALTRLCLSQQIASKVAIFALKQIARFGDRLAPFIPIFRSLPRFAYSGIYNLTYYQGAADELGGREDFFRLVSDAEMPIYQPHALKSGAN
ncbi:MAG: glycosyltransferase family 2 protein [Chloroflexota bacterium]